MWEKKAFIFVWKSHWAKLLTSKCWSLLCKMLRLPNKICFEFASWLKVEARFCDINRWVVASLVASLQVIVCRMARWTEHLRVEDSVACGVTAQKRLQFLLLAFRVWTIVALTAFFVYFAFGAAFATRHQTSYRYLKQFRDEALLIDTDCKQRDVLFAPGIKLQNLVSQPV